MKDFQEELSHASIFHVWFSYGSCSLRGYLIEMSIMQMGPRQVEGCTQVPREQSGVEA